MKNKENNKMKIEELRGKIDVIDDRIFGLLKERMELAKEIGSEKAKGGIKVLDSSREDEIINKRGEFGEIWKVIMKKSKELQREGCCRSGRAGLGQAVECVSGRAGSGHPGAMKDVLVIDGPNMNLLGKREPEFYGAERWERLKAVVGEAGAEYFQSNHEGEIIDRIQQTGARGIVINPAGYTGSYAIADALKAVQLPVVVVHVSDLRDREAFRRVCYIDAFRTVQGEGIDGYVRAIAILRKRFFREQTVHCDVTDEQSRGIYERLKNIAEYKAGEKVFCYVNEADEPATEAILKEKNAAVPLCIEDGVMVAIENYKELCPGKYGIMEPVSGNVTDDIDVAIIPGVAGDEMCNRMGHGKGYYDRWLSSHDCFKIMLLSENRICKELPVEKEDMKVDLIVTEKRVIRK